MNAGTYVRISKARDGTTLGVERQQPPCEALIERKGWTAAERYIDNDISAYSKTRRRAFERMLEDARSGRIGAVVAWDVDRLSRDPDRDNARIIELVDRYGIQLATVTGEYDLATSTGRLHFRIAGALARRESEHRAERLKLKHEELAKAGKPHGGGHRLFGLSADRSELVDTEAAVAREAAARLLRGQSVRSVVAWMNGTGVRTTTGRQWTSQTVRQLLKTPALAAFRTHQKTIVGDAAHPAVLDKEIWQAVNALLRDPTRVYRGRRVTYLLKGLAVCGRCGALLKSHPQQGKNRYRAYACLKVEGVEGGCGLSVVADPLEALIEERVLDRLAGPGLRRALATRDGSPGRDLAAELAAIDAKLDEVGRLWDDDQIDTGEYLRRRAVHEDRRAKLERELRSGIDRSVLAELPSEPEALRRWWFDPSTDVETKRNVVRALIARVVVTPAPKRGGRFDPSRVPPGNVEWKA
jgi:site-specific DNA recombinase